VAGSNVMGSPHMQGGCFEIIFYFNVDGDVVPEHL
jgi:hypothetical protein